MDIQILAFFLAKSPEEFDDFHQSLIDEFQPSGPSEDDVILNLAKGMWRKSRLGIYARAAKAREEWAPLLGASDMHLFHVRVIKTETSEKTELRQKVRDIYRDLSAHVTDGIEQRAALFAKVGESTEELVREGFVDFDLAALRELLTPEGLTKELELEARLETRIDRLLKRLFQLKAAKQMLGLSRTTHPEDRKLGSSQNVVRMKAVSSPERASGLDDNV